MGKWGKRYLWTCLGAGVVVGTWIGWEYYKWSIVYYDRQEAHL